MSAAYREDWDLHERLSRAEAQLRRLRIIVGVLLALVIGMLLPPVRELLFTAGWVVTMLLSVIVIGFAVLWLVSGGMAGLERLFPNRRRSSSEPTETEE